jgi:dipeptidyl aminopeptidase/acylaminoacyl peptidase
MNIKQLLFILFHLIILNSCDRNEEIPPKIKLEDFFRNPEKSHFLISPNGLYISFLAPYRSRMNIFIQSISDTTPRQITFETDRDIAGYMWANDLRLIYIKDEQGNEDYKLYGVDYDGKNTKCLTCFEGVRTQLIDHLEDNPAEVIIGLNKTNPQIFDPYRLNIRTGNIQLLAKNPGNIVNWHTDHDGKLRLAQSILPDGSSCILYRDSEEDDFKKILVTSWKETFRPYFFTFDNKMVYASSNIGRDKEEIVIFDPKSKSEAEIIYSHDKVDIQKLSYSKKRKVLTKAYYITDKKQYHFFDDFYQEVYNQIKSKLPDYEVYIKSGNKDESVFIVRTYSDKSRGSYYIFDYRKNTLKKIADISPWLNENHMADMEPIQYKSRDGLTIHGYLTLPKGRKPKNLPFVILPHGGPWIRDYWGFNSEVQFLANRGYAVLQMNYRGSKGYGKTFWAKSVKQWGKNMQNDVTDGVQWVINEGIANPEKICIYGSSFGGYVALCGITFTPDIYTCAIDYVGISNLFSFLETVPPYWEPMLPMLYEFIGHPEKDSLLLAEASPLFHVDKIKVPVFIAQGKNDPRVNVEEANQIVEKLKDSNINVTYMLKENEGHGFRNEENKFEFYQTLELFLNNHLNSVRKEKSYN